MWYAIMATDVANSLERRKAARPAHLERLKQLQAQERLMLAGPFPAADNGASEPPGCTGSLIIAAFDSLEQARTWAAADPYQAAGVYADVDVRPFRQSLP